VGRAFWNGSAMAECLVVIIILCEFVCGYFAVCSGEFGNLEEV
jgi:hypothetical protein